MSDSTKKKKQPDKAWVPGTITALPVAKAAPYMVRLETPVNGNDSATLYRKIAKKGVGYEHLQIGTSVLCVVTEREEGWLHRVRHCKLPDVEKRVQ